jgi:hypothetical protein
MSETVQERHRKALATRQAMQAVGSVALIPEPPGLDAAGKLQYKLDLATAVITALELALESNVDLQDRMERRVGPGSNVVRREAKDLASAALQLIQRVRPSLK